MNEKPDSERGVAAVAASPIAAANVTDITIDAIILRACEFEDRLFAAQVIGKAGDDVPTSEGEGVDLSAEIGVWLSEDHAIAFVKLLLRVVPRAQPSWSAMVDVVGRYTVGQNPVIPLERFAWGNGIAYLVPFVRERLVSLTANSVFGAYMLPPLSVTHILQMAKAAPPTTIQLASGANPGASTGQRLSAPTSATPSP